MKIKVLTIVGTLIVLLFLGCVFFMQPSQRPWAFPPTVKIPAPLWNFYQDTRLQYFTPSEVFTGTIEGIDPTNGSFLLSINPTFGLPIIVDPKQQKVFRDHTFNVGDSVTVHIGWRISSSRKSSQSYLRSIIPKK